MKFLHVKLIPVLTVLLVAVAGLQVLPVHAAYQDDWVLIDRFNRLLKHAKAGKVQAMYDVARLYEQGRGTDKNIQEAAKWYKQAAGAGLEFAMARLGILYFEGRGVEQNYQQALKLLTRAAKANVPSAQYQLANMYELGTGLPQNRQKALYWYTQAEKYGYYLAAEKIKRLKKQGTTVVSSNSGSLNGTINRNNAASAPASLLKILTSGQWFKSSKPVAYLPSNITNCVNNNFTSLHCVSSAARRSTGMEIITFNTESRIRVKDKTHFDVVYSRNVIDVKPLQVEDGDGNLIEHGPSRIEKGRQGKKHILNCQLKNKTRVSCRKGASTVELVKR